MASSKETSEVLPESLQRMVALAKTQGEDSVSSPEQISEDIAQRILAAESLDEILEGAGTLSAEDLADVAMTIMSVKWLESTIRDGLPVYCIFDAKRHDTGEVVTVTCGSRNVMAQLYRMQELGVLPADVRIYITETNSGYSVMRLVKP